MADLKEICDVVMKYAKGTNRFITPGGRRDPIQPAPASMGDDAFADFYFELLDALAEGGITARVPFEGLKNCRIWRDICMLVLHHQ